MTVEQPPVDITTLLESDHRRIEELLSRFEGIRPEDRAEYFCEVVHELVGHEVAEELVLYPMIRRHAPSWESAVDARLAEQAEAEESLAQLEVVEADIEEFVHAFRELRLSVEAHAEAEEDQIFPLLAAVESSDARIELGEAYRRAKKHAPTHPHPHVPDTPPGNRVLGPIAALFDKARDAVHVGVRPNEEGKTVWAVLKGEPLS